MGNLHRLQGCLFPHSDTGTVQEIPQILYPGTDLPVQSTSVRSVDSPHGVYCCSKGGKTDGHPQRYKDPPVPRRLVGVSQIPPGLSPADTALSRNLQTLRLAGECREVRTGTQTNFQPRRLLIRPRVRSGPTDTGPVAKPSGQDSDANFSTGLFGEGVYVLDRSTDGHRKTSAPGQTAHETDTVASQKQLENTGILGKTDSSAQISTSSFTMVAKRRQCPHRPTTTPYATCSADLYRRIKRRVGRRSLKRVHCQRNLVTTGKQTAYKLLGTKSSLSGSKRVPKAMHGKDGFSSNQQHYSSVLHQQRRRHEVGPTVCPILTWCTGKQVTLKARHIPGRLNVVADKLSRLGQTIQTEWSLLPEVFQALCSRWHRPQIDLLLRDSTTRCPCLYHQFRTPWPLQWTHSVCHGKIWTHTPSHRQPYWAKWWRSYKTPNTGG